MLTYSTLDEQGPLRVSKWLSLAMLVSQEELASAFETLAPFHIFSISEVLQEGEGEIAPSAFLDLYGRYVNALKEGATLEESHYGRRFTDIFTATDRCVYAIALEGKRLVIKPRLPIISLQPHTLLYSQLDGQVRSMVRGEGEILWGIQFSYPQIYQDARTGQIEKIEESEKFPNTALFRRLQRWVRDHTRPTPLEVGGKRINLPARLGKECFSWIHHHPQLLAAGIRVVG